MTNKEQIELYQNDLDELKNKSNLSDIELTLIKLYLIELEALKRGNI